MAEHKESLSNAQDEANSVVWRTEGYINKQALSDDVVPKRDYDILKSLIAHKEEEAYNKGYEEAVSEIILEVDSLMEMISADYKRIEDYQSADTVFYVSDYLCTLLREKYNIQKGK